MGLVIIVKTTNVDPAGVDLEAIFGVRVDPFPGDRLVIPGGRSVLVVRRTIHGLDAVNPDPDTIDLDLKVRNV